ncbi:MAG TPA: hypothetical protein VF329_13220 [Gammaproteobacteria bacterium]
MDEIDDFVTIVRHLLLRHSARAGRRRPRRAPAPAAAGPRAPSIADPCAPSIAAPQAPSIAVRRAV